MHGIRGDVLRRTAVAAVATTWTAAALARADDRGKADQTVRTAETVVVTATRTEQPAPEAPPSLAVLSAADLGASAAPTLDDALRQVPGFNLFRRTGSRVANPTSQGVSLRGLGPSGASRALVLVDGLRLNDPFGGWVYWGRVAREAVDRIEVLRGGASDLYGSSALGGVIQFVTRPPGARPDVSLTASGGNRSTAEASATAGGRAGGWGGRLSVGALTTDGHVLVDESRRGPVDTPAGARYATVDVTVDRTLTAGRAFLRGGVFAESRKNGTPEQTNRTDLHQVAAGLDHGTPRLGAVAVRIHASAQVYHQSFSAVAADRRTEALIRTQRVPAQDVGASAQWSRPVGSHLIVVGLLGREVRGASDEIALAAGAPTSAVGAGGRERTASLFAEDLWRVSGRVRLALSARLDRFRRFRALSATTPVGRASNVVAFPDRDESSWNPRAALLVRATDRLDLSASAYGSFRGPTLNELYRGFRVGDIVTQANPDLRAERLRGGEAGARWRGGGFTLSGAAFWSEVRDPVGSVTLSATPRLITRQRQNLGRTRARGLELDAEARFAGRWLVAGGYAFTDGVVASFPPVPELEGRILPQLPRHQASLRARYQGPRFGASVLGRAVGAQYEDDRNELRLGGYAVLDLTATWRLGRSAELFVAVENALDTRYAVGATPVPTVGPPRLARLGIRLRRPAGDPRR